VNASPFRPASPCSSVGLDGPHDELTRYSLIGGYHFVPALGALLGYATAPDDD
jgi:hypothetical protein